MAYRVSLAAPAEADAYAAFDRIRAAAPMACGEVAHAVIRGHFQLGQASLPVSRRSRGKRTWLSRPPFAVRQRERCLPDRFSCPGRRAACACLAHLARLPRCHHRRRRGGITTLRSSQPFSSHFSRTLITDLLPNSVRRYLDSAPSRTAPVSRDERISGRKLFTAI
jgi:hypothetical protein